MKKEYYYYLIIGIIIYFILFRKKDNDESCRDAEKAKRVSQAKDWFRRGHVEVPPNQLFAEPNIADNPSGSGNWEPDAHPDDINAHLMQRAKDLEENNASFSGEVNNCSDNSFFGEPSHITEIL
jgi:hypothetical protein